MGTAVLAVACMQLEMAIPAPLMFEQAVTELTSKWHEVSMNLECKVDIYNQ